MKLSRRGFLLGAAAMSVADVPVPSTVDAYSWSQVYPMLAWEMENVVRDWRYVVRISTLPTPDQDLMAWSVGEVTWSVVEEKRPDTVA